jgi:hypothetical protein
MAKETRAQQETVGRVMHEFKHGELKRGRGGKVRNRRQAVAIALSEAGASNQQSPQENRRRLAKTKAGERKGRTAQASREGSTTRAQLYQQAARKGVRGRSRMTKAELERAVRS